MKGEWKKQKERKRSSGNEKNENNGGVRNGAKGIKKWKEQRVV